MAHTTQVPVAHTTPVSSARTARRWRDAARSLLRRLEVRAVLHLLRRRAQAAAAMAAAGRALRIRPRASNR